MQGSGAGKLMDQLQCRALELVEETEEGEDKNKEALLMADLRQYVQYSDMGRGRARDELTCARVAKVPKIDILNECQVADVADGTAIPRGPYSTKYINT